MTIAARIDIYFFPKVTVSGQLFIPSRLSHQSISPVTIAIQLPTGAVVLPRISPIPLTAFCERTRARGAGALIALRLLAALKSPLHLYRVQDGITFHQSNCRTTTFPGNPKVTVNRCQCPK